jgi:hypothetical protein
MKRHYLDEHQLKFLGSNSSQSHESDLSIEVGGTDQDENGDAVGHDEPHVIMRAIARVGSQISV